ncbi:MAG: SAM hydroxide adenosyltransferase, partial [Acidimicrobiales bacterium]
SRSTGAYRDAARSGGSELEVPVAWIDGFGNIQLDVSADALDAIGIGDGGTAWVAVAATVAAAGHGRVEAADGPARSEPARRVGAFDGLDQGELGLMTDSNGRLALVLRRASAARRLDPLAVGDTVRIAAERPVGASG